VNGFGLELSDAEFQAFSDLVYKKAGINLHAGKKELVRARLAKRLREDGFDSFGEYYQFVINDETGDELVQLLDSISTNLTNFFREPKHFQFMVQVFLPEISRAAAKKGRRLRIWSAGCSTGEEPYSIAITVLENMPDLEQWDVKILATDLSTKVLATARRGIYPFERLADISPEVLRRWFQKGQGDWAGWFKVKDQVKRLIVFRRLNLIEPFPFQRSFDLIFCRNVMIYFDKKTQADLTARLHQVLADGGYLLIGHSESLTGVNQAFNYIQPTIYRKKT